MFDIRKATANAIERTQDPLASIKMQDAYASVSKLGEMLVSITTHDSVSEITSRILKGFTDDELDKANPAFVIALSALLREAIVRIGRSFADDPSV